MKGNWFDDVVATDDGFRSYQQEKTILDVTELICEIMEDHGVSRTELSKRLGKTKSHVSQLLDGETNMTIRTMSDIFLALGRGLWIADIPLRRYGNIPGDEFDVVTWNDRKRHQWNILPFTNHDEPRNHSQVTADLAG